MKWHLYLIVIYTVRAHDVEPTSERRLFRRRVSTWTMSFTLLFMNRLNNVTTCHGTFLIYHYSFSTKKTKYLRIK